MSNRNDSSEKNPGITLERILEKLPNSAGIYKFKNESGVIIYVGKAKNLKNRVRSYFQKSTDLDLRKTQMVEQIRDIEYIEVGTELEALFLETSLIKKLHPKYNIVMKDDKNYIYIRISTNEDFPRITTVRKVEKDKALYFGPKTADHKVKKTLETLRKLLPFRHCNLDIQFVKENPDKDHDVVVTHKTIKYPCLYYHIRKCQAPCIGKITPQEYKLVMDKIVDFLEGKPDELIEQIKSEMMEAAQKQKFEKAASLRDKLTNIEEILERQRISDPNRKDTDVFHYVVDQRKIYTNLFQIREGRIVGQENFIFSTGAEAAMEEGKESLDPSEIISTFIAEYYEKATNIPKEILIPDQVENQELLENWLSEKREKDGKAGRVKIIFPLLGEKNHLLELSLKNAASYAHQQKARWDKNENDEKENLEKLAEILKLKKAPKRMECYDISHVGGTDTVASMVVFTNGLADNGQYRRFRLKTIPDGKPDDYASMEEVLTRRLKYIKSKRFQYKFATKKALKEIQEKDDQATDPKNIFCIFEKEKLIGFIRLVDKKEIQNLWIHPDYRGEKLGHELILQLMEKQKEKKYYVTPEGSLTEYYENFGFQESKEDPSKMLIETAKTLAQHKKFAVKPDLMVIDGGKGQLAVAEKVMKKLQLDIPLCSLAKQEEEIFVPGEKTSILLPRDSKVLHLFQRIRDEAHRFAITYSTTSHRKGMFTSALDEIEGIGDLSRKKLLNAFGTIENIKMAPLDQLARVIGKKAAIKVKQELQKGK